MSVVASSDGGYDALLGSFITSVRADLDSPITSTFGSRIAEYRIEVCFFFFFFSLSSDSPNFFSRKSRK
ncbi:unnamed protein product [Gongylonema pulchrum]|uniref:Uncharacterized protein n=1 Tax=Gongylonema pulchrum TaxID=637853 RepID=A0A183DJ43_9BILA|nr:unnamed protein product [Gongylonema pulchrum]